MMKKFVLVLMLSVCISSQALAWEAKVTNILQHGNYVAVTLNPDPGEGKCEDGSPYILIVDDEPDTAQKFSMLLTAMSTGMTIVGYEDPCSSAIWGRSRPTIERLGLRGN
jgi:hypothetical protein